MARTVRLKQQRLLTVCIMLSTAVYSLCVLLPITPLSSLTHIFRNQELDSVRDAAKFEYFHGPAKVPKIPEEYFPKHRFDKKFFIYECTHGLCGGLADRQEGILAAYLIAQLMGRRFGVIMKAPCDITSVMEENRAAWIVPDEFLHGPSVSQYQVLDSRAWKLRSEINMVDLEKCFANDTVLFTTNQEFVQYLMNLSKFWELKWAQQRSVSDIYNIVLRRLFKLKQKYQVKYEAFQMAARKEGRQLVCAHVRLHFYRYGNYHVHAESVKYVSEIWKFIKQYNDSSLYRIFVSTNADLVRREAKQMFPEVIADMDGPLIHVDEYGTGPSACDGLAKALLDQLILSTCDVLFMSNSGFSRIAAMMRGTDDNLYNAAGKISFADKEFIPSYW